MSAGLAIRTVLGIGFAFFLIWLLITNRIENFWHQCVATFLISFAALYVIFLLVFHTSVR